MRGVEAIIREGAASWTSSTFDHGAMPDSRAYAGL